MKVDVVCRDMKILIILELGPDYYETALKKAFNKIAENMVTSRWKYFFSSVNLNVTLSEILKALEFGCFIYERSI